jgi:cytochrome c peroxidase
MERLALGLWMALTVVTLAGYVGDDQRAPAPRGFPRVPLPAGNLITEARGNLGRRLSYDEQLSPTNGISCATCLISFRN